MTPGEFDAFLEELATAFSTSGWDVSAATVKELRSRVAGFAADLESVGLRVRISIDLEQIDLRKAQRGITN